jgi:hypothetical protein
LLITPAPRSLPDSANLANEFQQQQTVVSDESFAPLGYPGLFVCNPIEALINPANATTVESTVTLHKSAEISDQWNSKTAATFYCPENVTFIVTDTDGTKGSVTCIDFKPAPPSASPCVTSRPKCAGKSAFSPTCASTPPPAWTSPSIDATIDMQLRGGSSALVQPLPRATVRRSLTHLPTPPPPTARSLHLG